MLESRKRLPAFNHREKILDLVSNNQVVVLSGETGLSIYAVSNQVVVLSGETG